MGVRYAELSDLAALGKSVPEAQRPAAEVLLDTASAKLRLAAKRYGKDLDKLAEDGDYALAIKNTVAQAVVRALNSIADTAPALSQGTQSALGYSVSMTYLNAGQAVYFLRNELKELGLLRQTYGALEVYSFDTDDTGH